MTGRGMGDVLETMHRNLARVTRISQFSTRATTFVKRVIPWKFAMLSRRHERRYIAPQVETPIVPPCPPNPLLRTPHVLDYHWNVMTCRFYGFSLNPEASLEKCIVRGRQSLRPLPRHCPVGIRLAGRRGDNKAGILESPSIEREDILKDKLTGIASRPVVVAFDVKADYFPSFRE
ncbi:MAG: hypothetical protein PHY29_02960 [Syntrophales bacterium]|nr:hypothetical protein [Syntrophales bacterium]